MQKLSFRTSQKSIFILCKFPFLWVSPILRNITQNGFGHFWIFHNFGFLAFSYFPLFGVTRTGSFMYMYTCDCARARGRSFVHGTALLLSPNPCRRDWRRKGGLAMGAMEQFLLIFSKVIKHHQNPQMCFF